MTSDTSGPDRLRTSNFVAVHLTGAAFLYIVDRWGNQTLPQVGVMALMFYLLFRVANRVATDIISSRTTPFVVRRHYADEIVEYKTLKRADAVAYALELLDGLAEFANSNRAAAASIIESYSVSISVPTRFAKNMEKIIKDLQIKAVDGPFSKLMIAYPEYGVVGTIAFDPNSTALPEVRLDIVRKDAA